MLLKGAVVFKCLWQVGLGCIAGACQGHWVTPLPNKAGTEHKMKGSWFGKRAGRGDSPVTTRGERNRLNSQVSI